MSKQLVCQYLEDISRDALESFQDTIRRFIKGRHGVYALYRKNKLSYVGIASNNLITRLNQHRKDRHANAWDRFSVYITLKDEHIKELEALVLRIADPKGNRQKTKFYRAEDLKKQFGRQVWQYNRNIEDQLIYGNKIRIKQVRKKAKGRYPILKEYTNKTFNIKYVYKGTTYRANVIRSGKIRYKGRLYNSPSKAAVAVAHKPRNGWKCWKYQRSPGEWVVINELRV
ncbi:MAG: hypothetical protein WC490_04410 [Candidatus Margulisiibacteriota bacterium]